MPENKALCVVCDRTVGCSPDGALNLHYLIPGGQVCAGSNAHPLVTACWMADVLPDSAFQPDDDGG